MSTIEQITAPEMVALDEKGLELYRAMRDAEKIALIEVVRLTSCRVFACESTTVSEVASIVFCPKRRLLTVIPPESLLIAHAAWPPFLADLEPTRHAFQAYLDSSKHTLKVPGSPGIRSTALPTWVGYDVDPVQTLVAEKIAYSSTAAYRAGVLRKKDVLEFVEKKRASLNDYIVNAREARQFAREEILKGRLKSFEAQLKKFKAIKSDVLARYLSGVGLKFHPKSATRKTERFAVPGFTFVVGKELVPAAKRKSSRLYGEPLMYIDECRLEIYDMELVRDAVRKGKANINSYKAATFLLDLGL